MNKTLARPVYNKKSNKWNISIEMMGQNLLLGHMDGCIAIYEEYDTKELALEYINSDDRLKLSSVVEGLI